VDKASGKLRDVITGVMKALTFSRQEEVKAWEQEFVPCEHTLCLQQQEGPRDVSQGMFPFHFRETYILVESEASDLGQCSMCSLKENLWLCLECGNLGCGRSQFGGIGGNSHGLAHADSSSHGVAVKLGSITPEGSADIYCYKCNEERIDPDLATHLSHWGINLNEQEKTEKSLMEMQVEQNLKWEFSMKTDDGQELKPLAGRGFIGLRNLGNSCYLASVVQCLFSLPQFQERYYQSLSVPPICDTPADDLETQLRKMADGLLSDRYVETGTNSVSTPAYHQLQGLAPAMLKHLVGRGHEEFSTMRQQDAFEFLLHLFKLISVSNSRIGTVDPTHSFRFALEQRLQCLACKKVGYKVDQQDNVSIPIPARRMIEESNANTESGRESSDPKFETVTLKECLDIFTGEEIVELTCPSCDSKDGFRKRSMFKTLPDILAINARRFELVNWVPTKLNIPVDICDGPFDMSCYLSPGLQDGEELLPDQPATREQKAFEPNQAALGQLISMGFPHIRCEKALKATGNDNPETAMEWLFAHMDDPDIDTAMDSAGTVGNAGQGDGEKLAQLGDMGINPVVARKALRETDGDVNRALDWVFSHPDEVADLDNDSDKPSLGEKEAKTELPGSSKLPVNFQLQSIVCHKGASVHAG
jgi:ubiquitin carboxyl-terminal hydrolase 5/13